MSLGKELEVTNNKLTTYFPIRTKDERKDFDWDSVLGLVVSEVYGKQLIDKDFSRFESQCEEALRKRLDEPAFWSTIREMYFDHQDVLKIAPEFLLFKSEQAEDNKHNQRIGEMFANMLGDSPRMSLTSIKLNFLERIIYETFVTKALKPEDSLRKREKKEDVFLPFLSECFTKDLCFLSSRPRYLLDQFSSFLKLYGFLYTSQLAHNLVNWDQGEPRSIPSYLILDIEKASQERREVRDYGYKQLYKHAHLIFPYLSMSEMLQAGNEVINPLWRLAQEIRESDFYVVSLNKFAKDFLDNRQLNIEVVDKESPVEALRQVLKLSIEQFRSGKKNKDDINTNYAKATLKLFCSDFIQHRGSAGATLVINQDYLLLLTNLVVGFKEKLRFNELVKDFETRGIYFDKQSQAELVQFYERIGNVERMSDSGDAVYVRKTV